MIVRYLIAAIITLAFPAMVLAQQSGQRRGTIEFDATQGLPVTQVFIGGVPLRFALDPLMGANVAVNPLVAELLNLRGIPNSNVDAGIDEVVVPGLLAPLGVNVNGRTRYTFGALIGRSHSPAGSESLYDVAGGFEALPARRIVVHLNRDLAGPFEDISFRRRSWDEFPGYPVELEGLDVQVNFHFANPATWMDRRATQTMVDEGVLSPSGALQTIPVWFGLMLQVQAVQTRTEIMANGLALPSLHARTQEPLVLPRDNSGGITVSALAETEQPPVILIGTDALSHCERMTFNQRTSRLTLRCQNRD